MKKVWILGGILTILGGIIAIIGLGIGNKEDFSQKSKGKQITNSYSISDSFEIQVEDEDVRVIEKESGADITVTYPETYEVEETENQLVVKRTKKSQTPWYRKIMLVWETKSEIVVQIPKEYEGSVTIEGTSSDIVWKSETPVLSNVNIKNVDGDIEIEGMKVLQEMNVKAMSGDITMKQSQVRDTAKVVSVDGEIRITDSTINSLIGKTTSGDIVTSALSSDSIEMHAIDGDIVCKKLDGTYEEYSVQVNLVDGDSNISSKEYGRKRLELQTTSGDIKVDFRGSK